MQGELDFNRPIQQNADGIEIWRKQRAAQTLELARKLGLPIGRNVEVWLRGGVRLRGRLRLQEETLIETGTKEDLSLGVDGTEFSLKEMESCQRIEAC